MNENIRRIREFLKNAVLFGWVTASANKCNERGVQLTVAAPIGANSGVGPNSGDPLLIGRGTCPTFGLACVAESSYTPPTGVATGNIAVSFEGVYYLQVVAKSSIGGSSVAIAIGDKIYADGGTYDPVTGMLYGFTLDANSTAGAYFGNALDALTSGATGTIRVRLKVSG